MIARVLPIVPGRLLSEGGNIRRRPLDLRLASSGARTGGDEPRGRSALDDANAIQTNKMGFPA